MFKFSQDEVLNLNFKFLASEEVCALMSALLVSAFILFHWSTSASLKWNKCCKISIVYMCGFYYRAQSSTKYQTIKVLQQRIQLWTYFAISGSCRSSNSIVSVFSNTPHIRAAHSTPNINAVQMTTTTSSSSSSSFICSNAIS